MSELELQERWSGKRVKMMEPYLFSNHEGAYIRSGEEGHCFDVHVDCDGDIYLGVRWDCGVQTHYREFRHKEI